MAQPWWPPSTGIWDWGHPVVTVTAGCTSILDRNWKTKNSHLIGEKLVFRLEASLSYGGTSVPVLARQSSFQMDDDGDLHEQILHTEAHIEELTDIIERCRKIILISKAAIAAGGTLILAIIIGAVGFDPTVLIGSLAAVIGGTVVFGSNASTLKQTMTDMKAAEAHRTELIDRMDLRVVEDGEVESTSKIKIIRRRGL